MLAKRAKAIERSRSESATVGTCLEFNSPLGALSLLASGFFYADEEKRPTIHIKSAVTVALMESIEASAMLACRPVTNDW